MAGQLRMSSILDFSSSSISEKMLAIAARASESLRYALQPSICTKRHNIPSFHHLLLDQSANGNEDQPQSSENRRTLSCEPTKSSLTTETTEGRTLLPLHCKQWPGRRSTTQQAEHAITAITKTTSASLPLPEDANLDSM